MCAHAHLRMATLRCRRQTEARAQRRKREGHEAPDEQTPLNGTQARALCQCAISRGRALPRRKTEAREQRGETIMHGQGLGQLRSGWFGRDVLRSAGARDRRTHTPLEADGQGYGRSANLLQINYISDFLLGLLPKMLQILPSAMFDFCRACLSPTSPSRLPRPPTPMRSLASPSPRRCRPPFPTSADRRPPFGRRGLSALHIESPSVNRGYAPFEIAI